MKLLNDFETAVNKLPAHKTPTPGDIQGGIKAYWPILKLVLQFVKIFTGEKTDEKIDQIITWGDSIAN